MSRSRWVLLCAVLALSLNFQAFSAIKTDWKFLKEQNGIKVFKGEVVGSEVVAFRGVAVIDAPLMKVASVLYDMSRKKEWIHNVVEATVLENTGATSRIEYNHTATPWPLDDRDFVFKVKVDVSDDKKMVTLKLNSVNDEKLRPARKGIVRGELKESIYVIRSIENGKKTSFQVDILADPKGSVPKWLVNVFQKAWPIKTITGLKNQVKRADLTIHPRVRTFLQKNKKMTSVR